MPTENKNKNNTPECFFCGRALDRVHEHMRIQDAAQKMEPSIFCCHERCSAAGTQLLQIATKYLETEKPRESTYLG